MVIHLGDGGEGWYDVDTARTFKKILEGEEDVFFLNPSVWGVDYTLARPLIDSTGEHYGLLCADISVDELNTVVYRNIYINISVIIVAGILFIILLLLWMRANVTMPLKLVEKSVVDFADTSAGKRNPDELVYREPPLKVHNEVKSLSVAMSKLSGDMRNYVKGMIDAEDENRGLQTQVYEDALTKVKNKAAYDKKVETLNWDIQSGIAEFGIAMVDLNNLKVINDKYGHEHGNEYIVGASHAVCRVFKHSPVYRIGGDEFVVVVQGSDYGCRDKLCEELKSNFESCMKNQEADPWNRYSAAVGMSTYEAGDSVEDVFERADQAMYEEKTRMKREMPFLT